MIIDIYTVVVVVDVVAPLILILMLTAHFYVSQRCTAAVQVQVQTMTI